MYVPALRVWTTRWLAKTIDCNGFGGVSFIFRSEEGAHIRDAGGAVSSSIAFSLSISPDGRRFLIFAAPLPHTPRRAVIYWSASASTPLYARTRAPVSGAAVVRK